MKILFLILAVWTPLVVHPVKDAATHEMLRATARENDRAVREESQAALEFIAGTLATNQVLALPALEATGWTDAQVVERLQSPVVWEQETAVRAAGERGLTNAAPVLVTLLNDDDDERLRRVTCEVLGRLRAGAPAVGARLAIEESSRVRRTAVAALLAVHDRPTLELLTGLLTHERWQSREAAVQGLAEWGDRELALRIAPLVRDASVPVQVAAATALGRLVHPATEQALLNRLGAADGDVLPVIIWALGEFRSKPAIPSLIKWVKGTNDHLGEVAAEALGKMEDERVIPTFRHLIFNVTYLQTRTRAVALRQLREHGDDTLADRMVQFVTERVVPPPPMALGPIMDSVEARREALLYLHKYGTAQHGARIIERMKEPVPAVLRPRLAEVLTKLTGAPYRPVPDQSYRQYFVESLGPSPYPLAPLLGVVSEQPPGEAERE